MMVGGPQSLDISAAQRTGIAQTLPSPRKPFPSQLHRQQIGHEAGVAAVAIREGVNLHQPVMETHRDLIRRISVVRYPGFGIVQQLAQGDWNFPVVYPDVAFGGPELSRPAPDVAEHPPVQVPDEFLAQQIAAAAECPPVGARDVLLLRFV